MNTTETAAPGAYIAPAENRRAQGEFLNELGRVYLEIGLPLALAFEAALADLRTFQLASEVQP